MSKSKRIRECELLFPETDPIVSTRHYRQANFAKASDEASALILQVAEACKRNVSETSAKLHAAKGDRETMLRTVLNGGWLGVTLDRARHWNTALKVETLEVCDDYADTLTVSIEAHGSHQGDYFVTLVPTLTQYRDGREEIKHAIAGKTQVVRTCPCEPMSLRGLVLGTTDTLEVSDILNGIRRVRGYVSSLNSTEALLKTVKAVEQFDSRIKTARNLWTGDDIRRDKVTTSLVTL